jgi:hypothetical protein
MPGPRKILLEAVVLTVALSILAACLKNVGFASAILAGGALVAGNFWLGARRIETLSRVTLQAGEAPSIRPLVWLLRLAGVLAVLWLLLHTFEPLGLLVGLSSVVAVVSLEALRAAARSTPSTSPESP